MTISKQGMLVLHSIAVTVLLLLTMSWQAPMPSNKPGVEPTYPNDIPHQQRQISQTLSSLPVFRPLYWGVLLS